MEMMLGDEFEAFLASYESAHLCGLRSNSLKISPSAFEKLNLFNLKRIPWIENGFYTSVGEDTPSKHPLYYAGVYYIQEPSAMTPASLLPVKPGDRVLDLCAAPGGKSTELAAKLAGRGLLLANDISNSRAKALLKNLELFGVVNQVCASEPPAKLSERFEGFFDCILVDAPCSGEGMFRKSRSIIKNWEQYGVEYYVKLQRQILPEAVKMLRPGGYMVYSTCTFSPEENEQSLGFILENYPEMHVVPAVSEEAMKEGFAGFVNADPSFAEALGLSEERRAEIANALRIYPHKVGGEGHFVALLKKDEEQGGAEVVHTSSNRVTSGDKGFPNSYDRKRYKNISDEAFDFLEKIRLKVPADRIEVRDERLFLLPEGLPDVKGLRLLRCGLLLGEMKKGRFEPSQALAMALKKDDYENTYDMELEDPDVKRYLKCESIASPEDVEVGYVLVCAGGFPLGWGKKSKGSFKNKYLPGWRLM